MKFKINVKNNPLNFFKHWRKHGFKETMKQWKYNYVMLDTPEQLMKKELIGYVGSMLGVILAIVMFWIKGSWYLIPLMFFTLIIIYYQFKAKWKNLEIFKQARECLEQQEDLQDNGL